MSSIGGPVMRGEPAIAGLVTARLSAGSDWRIAPMNTADQTKLAASARIAYGACRTG